MGVESSGALLYTYEERAEISWLGSMLDVPNFKIHVCMSSSHQAL